MHEVSNRTRRKLNNLYNGKLCVPEDQSYYVNLSSIELTDAQKELLDLIIDNLNKYHQDDFEVTTDFVKVNITDDQRTRGVGEDLLPLSLSFPLIRFRAGGRYRSLCLSPGDLHHEGVPSLGQEARQAHLVESGATLTGGKTVLGQDSLQISETQTFNVSTSIRF